MYKIAAVLLFVVFTFGCSKSPKQESAEYGHDHHDHEHTPHMGVLADFKSDKSTGTAELKLHDDKGDLELWLTKDKTGKEAFDLPLGSVIKVTFPKLDNKSVELKVRNTDKNEDEDGQANIREKKTNYFIFPGDTGVDASFLVGKEFSSEVIISFTVDGTEYKTASFVLKPHVH